MHVTQARPHLTVWPTGARRPRPPRRRAWRAATRAAATRGPGTGFEQVCGAAQAALRISRLVSDVVRAYGVAGGRYG